MAVSAISSIPWKEIIKAVPLVVESARKFYLTRRGRSDAQKDTVIEDDQSVARTEDRLRTLEDDATSQAEIVAQMAEQVEALSMGLRTLSVRATVFMWIGAGVTVLAVVAIVVSIT